MPIHVGIHEPSQDRKRVKNTTLWVDADGKIGHRYQKLHLFDVDVPRGPVLKESGSVEPGPSIPMPFASPLGKVGSMICFDPRFPMLSSKLRDLGAEILTYPSAFTVPTGDAGHWHTLLTARAIENQSYVIAAAQVGQHGAKRASYGHSLIVDPWGKVLGEGSGIDQWDENNQEPTIICAEIDLNALERLRRDMPLKPRRDIVDVVQLGAN